MRIIKSRRMRWVGHVAGMGEKRNVYRLLVGKPEGNMNVTANAAAACLVACILFDSKYGGSKYGKPLPDCTVSLFTSVYEFSL
jgi:hypothetical protein